MTAAKGQISLFGEGPSPTTSGPSTTTRRRGEIPATHGTDSSGGGSSSKATSKSGSGTKASRRGAKTSPKAPRKKQIPCVFEGEFIRGQVDPRIKEEYGTQKVPWGDFRRQFKIQYCRRVNPTGHPEDCPFPEEDCAMTFMQTALQARDGLKPGALFRVLAKSKGLDRADNRPLTRDRVPAGRPSNLPERPTSGQQGSVRGMASSKAEPVDGSPMPGRTARPASLAEVLGSLNLGARQGPAPDGEEGPGR